MRQGVAALMGTDPDKLRKNTVHLVSNAHLDPVWQWQWEEGALEALSTFRTAIDLLQRFPNYVFVHNESLLYEWVEEYDPALFEKIARFVKDGRWIIVGGWYVQPDCNIPGGESFVRQILYAKRFFKEKFDTETTVAFNVDSFGHNGGLPQILCKSGYKYYVHTRPEQADREIPNELYVWRGLDGSEIIAYRPKEGSYYSDPGFAGEKAQRGIELSERLQTDTMILWGIGDHGGVASMEDLQELESMIESNKDIEVRHSHPEAFFKAMEEQRASLPVIEGDLQRCFPGCYTSAAYLKRGNRRSEGLVAQAERLAVLAHLKCGLEYPAKVIETVWKDILFNQFHDILAGTSSEGGTQDGIEIYGHCTKLAREIRLKAALSLASLDPPEKDGIPVYVFNPHSFAYEGPIEIDLMIDSRPNLKGRSYASVEDTSGNVVVSQEELSTSVMPYDWRKRIVVWAKIPPLASRRYMVHKLTDPPEMDTAINLSECAECITVNTGRLLADIDLQTGLLCSLFDLKHERELLRGQGVVPFVVDDPGDSWGRGIHSFGDIAGIFLKADPSVTAKIAGYHAVDESVPSVRIIESGPVRTVVESVLSYEASSIVQQYYFYPNVRYVGLKLRVIWNEPRRMLKLSVPTVLDHSVATCEIPYGAIGRDADGTEHSCQRWITLQQDGYALGLINDGQYGFDVKDGDIRLSLLRSPIFCHSGDRPPDRGRAYQFMDIGVHDIQLAMVFGDDESTIRDVIRVANQMNIPAFVLPYSQSGPCTYLGGASNAAQKPLLAVAPETVVMGALKMAEDGDGYIVRLHESAGKETDATISLIDGPKHILLQFTPFELKTFRLKTSDGAITLQGMDLVERPTDTG